MLIALLCFVESQICAVLFKHYVQIMLHYALPVIETIMFLLKLMKIGKNKISYSSPPPCVARRRKFLVVQRDVNWLLILEIREWDDALVPTVSTSLHCLQFCFHTGSTHLPTLLGNPLPLPIAVLQTTRQPV